VGCGPVTDSFADVPDLGVDESEAHELFIARCMASVEISTSFAAGSPVHPGIRTLVASRLEGRRPRTILRSDTVQVIFTVPDESLATQQLVIRFGSALSVSVGADPQIAMRCWTYSVDTSDIDHLLPPELQPRG